MPRVNSDPLKSPDIHPPLLNLNGHTDAVWEVIDKNPDALPNPIANKFMAATGRNLEGRQVRALIKNRPLN